MFIYTYTAKGPKNTLIAHYITGVIKVYDYDFNNLEYEQLVPHFESSVKPIKNIDNLIYLSNKVEFNFRSINCHRVNNEGNLAIKNALDRMILKYKIEALDNKEKYFIKEVVVKKLDGGNKWPERLLMVLANYYRQEYLINMSGSNYDLLDLEKNYDLHLDTLVNYTWLPPLYKWEKTMQVFKTVYPRPIWYEQELKKIKEI